MRVLLALLLLVAPARAEEGYIEPKVKGWYCESVTGECYTTRSECEFTDSECYWKRRAWVTTYFERFRAFSTEQICERFRRNWKMDPRDKPTKCVWTTREGY